MSAEILRLFDEAVRRRMTPPSPAYVVETEDGTTRLIGPTPAAFDNGVFHSVLTPATADAAIERAVARFAALGHAFEWKVFAYDEPCDLPGRLARRGFVAEETETVMAFDLSSADLPRVAPGMVIRRLFDPDALHDFRRLIEAVSGEDRADFTAAIAGEMRAQPQTVAIYVAYDGELPVSAARLIAAPGEAFASLWGGATLPSHRGRGIYRALVGERAREAKARGARYLTIDARETSRPIVARLGFVPVTTTTPFVWTPA